MDIMSLREIGILFLSSIGTFSWSCRPSSVMFSTFTSHTDDQGSVPTGDRSGQMQGRSPSYGVNCRGSSWSFEYDTSSWWVGVAFPYAAVKDAPKGLSLKRQRKEDRILNH